jgi:hypothetical protein
MRLHKNLKKALWYSCLRKGIKTSNKFITPKNESMKNWFNAYTPDGEFCVEVKKQEVRNSWNMAMKSSYENPAFCEKFPLIRVYRDRLVPSSEFEGTSRDFLVSFSEQFFQIKMIPNNQSINSVQLERFKNRLKK